MQDIGGSNPHITKGIPVRQSTGLMVAERSFFPRAGDHAVCGGSGAPGSPQGSILEARPPTAFRFAIPTEASRRAYPILKNDLLDFRHDLSVDSISYQFFLFSLRGYFSFRSISRTKSSLICCSNTEDEVLLSIA